MPDVSVIRRRLCFGFVSRHLFVVWQLSYANTHPMFTKRNFPNFYRIVPNVRYLDVARVEFVKLHGWKRVGTLCQDDPRYTLVGISRLRGAAGASIASLQISVDCWIRTI